MNRLLFAWVFFALFACNGKPSDTPGDTANPENNPTPADQLAENKKTENPGSLPAENNKPLKTGHEQNQSAFPELKTVSPAGFTNAFVFYDPEHTQLINSKDTAKEAEPSVLVLKTRLDNKEKDIYTVLFSPGLSNDPLFTIKKGKKEVGSFTANELIIPGNGTLYTTGRTNNLFEQKRKYQLRDGKVQEVKQPFLYVGLKTRTKSPVQLYSSMDYKQVLTSLPKNTEIEVLVSTGKNYLLRTPFGLTGWWRNTPGKDSPLEGLKFEGD